MSIFFKKRVSRDVAGRELRIRIWVFVSSEGRAQKTHKDEEVGGDDTWHIPEIKASWLFNCHIGLVVLCKPVLKKSFLFVFSGVFRRLKLPWCSACSSTSAAADYGTNVLFLCAGMKSSNVTGHHFLFYGFSEPVWPAPFQHEQHFSPPWFPRLLYVLVVDFDVGQ